MSDAVSSSNPTTDSDNAISKAVCLTPLTLSLCAETVHRVFFKHWQPTQTWRVHMGPCEEDAAFSCDRGNGVITFAQRDFADRDDLRCALIAQFALANSSAADDRLVRAVTIELKRCLTVAQRLHHHGLQQRLGALIQRFDDGDIELKHDLDHDEILTQNQFSEPDDDDRCEAWVKTMTPTMSENIYEDPLTAAALAAALDRERRQSKSEATETHQVRTPAG